MGELHKQLLQFNFYPRPPRGGRPSLRVVPLEMRGISIHALREEGDIEAKSQKRKTMNFYPRPPRGGRRDGVLVGRGRRAISIHALREEGDSQGLQLVKKAGGFLSTPSARRATAMTT